MAKKKETQKNEVAKTQSNDIATTEKRRGFDMMDKSTIKPPQIKLLQSTSPEVQDDEFEDFGFRAGKLVNTLLLEEVEGDFVPLMIFDNKTLLNPRNDEEKQVLIDTVKSKFGEDITTEVNSSTTLLCIAEDNAHGSRFGKCSECKLCDFDGDRKPIGNKNINVIGLFPEFEGIPCLFRFTSTSYKQGSKFKNLAYYSGGDLFSKKYKLVPKKKSDGGNTWYILTVKPNGVPTDEEKAMANELYDMVNQAELEVVYDNDEYNEAESDTDY
jgi:hypothetical protein